MSCAITVKFQGFSTVPLWTSVLCCLGLSVVGPRSWWIPGHICCRSPPKTPSLNICILKLESNHWGSKSSLTLQQLCHAAQASNPSCTKRIDRAYSCLYSVSAIAWHHFPVSYTPLRAENSGLPELTMLSSGTSFPMTLFALVRKLRLKEVTAHLAHALSTSVSDLTVPYLLSILPQSLVNHAFLLSTYM